ncbi:SDR family NAD(P)-dependent oxidoreductase [Leptospira licerasiae]|uniref:KR domain protein n=1 Tax=Leptospira licerasiae str. MMD4847 TaxID=1049971 RepID=A0ABN0H7L7_9LEPT|nr:SDR family oxidoreductase [Leptospira licerasiae]EJZ41535.1 KR domain protein [Leptospira licerasiae str. MMD4847]TGM91011.1 SDR family oxidoreductase [Leptospira licerasiae]
MKALVTGASEGIGREFAKQLAAKGYQITAVARNEARLKQLVDELGKGHSFIVADLSDPKSTAKIQKELEDNHYNLLINNAGFGVYGPFDKADLHRLQAMTRLNIDSLVSLSYSFLKNSKEGDSLMNISSTLGLVPMPSSGVYSATKAFVTSFSESLWYEQRKRGVYVMGLCPGVTVSNFFERAGGDPKDFPKAIAQSAETLVEYALAALKKRSSPTVVSGLPNKVLVKVSKLIGRKATVKLMGKMR